MPPIKPFVDIHINDPVHRGGGCDKQGSRIRIVNRTGIHLGVRGGENLGGQVLLGGSGEN